MRCQQAIAGLILSLVLIIAAGCRTGPNARSRQSFDEIATRVAEMSASEIAALLGDPDSRRSVYLHDERWIWWNYTFLAGEDYPPEVRGQVVHLEITFRNPSSSGREPRPYSEWRVARPFGVAYRTPGSSLVSEATPALLHEEG